MDFLKSLFENGAIDWDTFSAGVTEKGYKLADLATGKYVDKRKFETEVKKGETLQEQLTARDTDIANLKTQLESKDTDTETKVADLTSQITKLQGDYANAQKDFEKRLSAQSYDFAVREYANSKQFTSSAAKRDFINEMLSENLKMKDKMIIGADDFMKLYTEQNPDAIKVEQPKPEPQQQPEVQQQGKPFFVQPTTPQADVKDNVFANAFHFAGVRAHE